MPSILIITPTFRRDAEQFALLRESIKLFAPRYRHLTIVHTEDYNYFRQRFGAEPNLEILATADVLPASIERRRRKSRHRWAKAIRKLMYGHWVSGWHFQQLTKIYALAGCSSEGVAFIDSDVFLCRSIPEDYFYLGDSLKLYRRRALTAEQMGFDVATHAVLRNSLQNITELYDFIFQPTCFRKATAVRLLEKLNERSAWVYRFLLEPRVSEYNLLGYTATVLERGEGYHLIECNPEDVHYSIRYAEDKAAFAGEFDMVRGQPKDFVWIQSTLRVPPSVIRNAFNRVLEANGQTVRLPP